MIKDNQEQIEYMCYELHKLFNNLKRYNFNTIDQIPFDYGIYVFFGENEKYKGMDRIIRVGISDTRTLQTRIKNHFIDQNDDIKTYRKDGSSFRKFVGRAMLYKNNKFDLIKYWDMKLNKPDIRKKYFNYELDKETKALEHLVTNYMREKMQFVVIEVNDLGKRKRLENAIIATLYNDKTNFVSSDMWLGNYSQKSKESRMWLTKGINEECLNEEEFNLIKQICLSNYSDKKHY